MAPTETASRSANRSARRPTIRMRDVTVERGHQTAVSIETLDIGPGVTALVGPNGSGKSTLLHTITGLLRASGTIEVLGQRPAAARARVAYVLQSQHASEHLLVTAREVVALGRAAGRGPFRPQTAADRAAVGAAMEPVEIADLANHHLADMSGGQRQRVFVAQGLAQEADILLLDEPMAGLDLASIQGIRRVIAEERAGGRAIVIATHDLGDAAQADQAVLIDRRVIAAGPAADVLTPAHLRTAYGARVLDLGEGSIAVDDGVHHLDHEHHHHDHHEPAGHHEHAEVRADDKR
jgi:ABC-type Mn2+/Zn2+ transport system ATPase subunit